MLIDSLLTRYMRSTAGRLLAFSPENGAGLPSPSVGRELLLYVHIPFCESLCPYCSFNRIQFDESVAARYFRALKKEMHLYAERGYEFNAVYVGGGTPTVMPGELSGVLQLASELWPVKEVSVETNPNHLVSDKIERLKDAGVNRLSVGVQTFDDKLLAGIGRLQAYGSGSEIRRALDSAAGVFDTLNIDLIFNLPGQDADSVARDVRVIKELKADQVTFYPLMPSDVKKRKLQDESGRIDYRKERDLYRIILRELGDDYRPASAWCFSRGQGMIDEYIIDNDEFAGIGSGSFGYIGGMIYSNTFSVDKYIETLDDDALPVVAARRFSLPQQVNYDILRRLFGGTLKMGELAAKHGAIARIYELRAAAFLVLTGAAVLRGGEIRLTPKGRYYLVVLMREFFTAVNNLRQTCQGL